MKLAATDILVRPVVTEKSMGLAENDQIYTFLVIPHVNKIQIKQAVEELFNVKVDWIRTTQKEGKARRQLRRRYRVAGRTNFEKKAYIKLKAGFTLPKFFEPG
ncbi:MAG: 50S ribosomal protein L23 [bacterium]